MKKKYIIAALFILILSLSFSACKKNKEKPADWGEWTVTAAPGCETEGQETRINKTDGTAENRAIAPKGHNWGDWADTTAPACITAGVKTRVCADCGNNDPDSIPALGHDWDEWQLTTQPACMIEGVETTVCKTCGANDLRHVLALDHDWSNWVTEIAPTCDTLGVETKICRNDNNHPDIRNVPALGHDWSEWVIDIAPGCETEGQELRICKNDNSHTQTQPVPALGHDWSNWVVLTPVTEIEDGKELRVCRNDRKHIETRLNLGDGTQENPYRIFNKVQLIDFSNSVNAGEKFTDTYFRLVSNIDLSGMDWKPIGVNNNHPVSTPSCSFDGNFDGNGFVISNLTIETTWMYMGLFGYTTGIVENLTLKDIAIEAIYDKQSSSGAYDFYVGGLAGYSGGTVDECRLSGTINITTTSGSRWGLVVGGLVGINYGMVKNSYAVCDIIANGFGYTGNAGGLVAWNYVDIANCFAAGNVSASGGTTTASGGLVSGNLGNIINSYATGNVSAVSVNTNCYAGGLSGSTGYSSSNSKDICIIKNCYATGDVSTKGISGGIRTGGLVGIYNGGAIVNCFATGNLNTKNSSAFDSFGGLVGQNSHTEIINSYRYTGQIFDRNGNPDTTNTAGTRCAAADLDSSDFYLNALGWDETWDLSDLDFVNGFYPKLKNLNDTSAEKHDWDGWTVTLEPTQTTDGLKTRTCSICGEMESRKISAYGREEFIFTKEDLIAFAAEVNGGNSFMTARVKLMADINLGGMEWTPIGTDGRNYFAGVFDGNGHTISNFVITTARQYTGLFGYSGGIIKNLGVKTFDIDLIIKINYPSNSEFTLAGVYAGGLIGYCVDGSMTSSYAVGNVAVNIECDKNTPHAGGLAGYCSESVTVTNCYFTGSISAISKNTASVGGLLGLSNAKLTNCYSAGNVSVSGSYSVSTGGLVGNCGGSVTNCFSTCDISESVTLFSDLGGLIGYSIGDVVNCYRYSGQTISPKANNIYGEECTLSKLNDTSFYTGILKWDSGIWNLTDLNFSIGRYPTLNT